MTDLAIPGMAYAYANYGRWVVDCPRLFCDNAMQVDRWQERFACDVGPDACGYTSPITWPADPETIEELLKMRPTTKTRNWLVGETLEDLLMENVSHDCLPPEMVAAALAAGGPSVLLKTAEDRAVGGLIYRQLEAARRREIGA